MQPSPAEAALACLRSALAPPAADARLVAAFVNAGDPQAFAELVRRHGPMVLAVCRRTASDAHLAEDAFQATFLVLARRASSVRPPGAVGAFLHGVAYRTALRVRAMAARRRARETTVAALPDVAGEDPCPAESEALRALDEEIARLPDILRTAVVLVELEGQPRAAVARSMGVPEGTLSSRLAKARKALADRLRRRGLGLPATMLAARAVPSELLATAAGLAAPVTISPNVAALAAGVMSLMFMRKMKLLVVFALLLACSLAASSMSPAGKGPEPAPAGRPAAGLILIWREGHAFLCRPDGKVEREWKGKQVPYAADPRLSPDGRTIAARRRYEVRELKTSVEVGGGRLPASFKRNLYRLTTFPVAEELVGKDVELPGDSVESVTWSADGSRLYAGTHEDDEADWRTKDLTYRVIDRAGSVTVLKTPPGHHIRDVSPDGKALVMVGPTAKITDPRPVVIVPAMGGAVTKLDTVPGSPVRAQFSPDGKRILFCGSGWKVLPAAAGGRGAPSPAAGVAFWLDTVEVATGKRKAVVELPPGRSATQCRWSPDGRRIVYLRLDVPSRNPAGYEQEVIVCDADGRNEKVIYKFTGWDGVIIDWR
jgi:RNA polymerase sigma factor (sigma-70 family)